MYCQNRMVHTVQEGDSLYRLARQYHTTVTELILGNPGVNPYNLQVGMKLYVCPGESYVPPQGGSANTGNTGNSGSTGNTGNAGNGGNTSNAGVGGNIGIGVANCRIIVYNKNMVRHGCFTVLPLTKTVEN